MLVLARQLNQSLKIGDAITVTVVRISDGSVRLGIDAPRGLNIVREELGPVRSCDVCGGDGWVPDMSGNLPNGQTAGPFCEKRECPGCDGKKTRKIQADEADIADLGRVFDPLGVAAAYDAVEQVA